MELSLLSLLTQRYTDPYCCINRRDCADPIKSKRSLEWVCLLFPALRFFTRNVSLQETEKHRVFVQLSNVFNLSDEPQGTDGSFQTPSRGVRVGNPAT